MTTNPFEYLIKLTENDEKRLNRGRTIGWLLTLAATLGVAGAVKSDNPWIESGIGLQLLTMAAAVDVLLVEWERKPRQRLRDYEDLAAQGVTQAFYDSIEAANLAALPILEAEAIKETEKNEPTEWFDISRLRNRDDFPHFIVVGGSGDGKSLVTEYLVNSASASGTRKVYASPIRDDSKNEFLTGFELVGCGLNYSDNQDFRGLKKFYLENQKEAQKRSRERWDWQVTETVVDEALVQIDGLSGLSYRWADWWLYMITYSRKLDLRTWLLSISDDVTTLGIQGQGKLRDNCKYIYVGSSALKRAETLSTLRGSAFHGLDVRTWWKTATTGSPPLKLVLVDDLPLILTMQELLAVRTGSAPSYENQAVSSGAESSEPLTELPGTAFNGVCESGKNQEISATSAISGKYHLKPEVLLFIQQAVNRGVSKTQICKELLPSEFPDIFGKSMAKNSKNAIAYETAVASL